ncbi:MAG: acetylxylan esterase, partial [Planctomycetota bacterium]|nr:acetylxylan esterase [Planctomycetota bacterium]
MAETAVARSGEFLEFIRRSARELRHGEAIPESLDQWKELRTAVRKNLVAAIGLSTDAPGPVPVRKVGEQKKDGYRIEHLVLRTIRTGDGWIEMPANAYVPDAPSKNAKPMPAVLCVHGHWSGAKQDPVVQSRCIGLAKLGFFVLSVDAFGAGERGLKTPL